MSSGHLNVGSVASQQQGATVSRSGRTVTLTLLSTHTVAAGETVNLGLAANVVTDAAGNGNLPVTGTIAVINAVGGPTVSGVVLTSAPGSDSTYAIGDTVEATVTFAAAVDITGSPQLELNFAGTAKAAACATGTNTTTMACSYTVVVGDSAPKGVAIPANKLTGGTIYATGSTTDNAVRTHAAVLIDAEHKVDGVRPTLVTTGSDAPTMSTDGTKVILIFSEAISVVDRNKITIGIGGGQVASTAGSLTTGTRLELTLTTAPTATSTNLTVALAADAVEDAATNGNLALAATAVTNAITLTASFKNLPTTHDGSSEFTFHVEFSEDVGISYAVLRDDGFAVTKGEVTGARRVNGRNDLWEITVEPDGREAITITLPGNRSCNTSGAVCSRGDNPRELTNSPSATVNGPPEEPLTATFENMPAEHDGSEFTFDLAFSENVAAGYARVRDDALRATGATIGKAQRKTQGSNQNWTITVKPSGTNQIGISLPATPNCDAAGAICTDDGRKLSHSTSASVLGPVGISIADVEVEEGAGVVMAFAVRLTRAASSQMTVAYATADGTATAGADYTATSGTLTIRAGSSSATIQVSVIDDDHDEGSETFTMTLSDASSGQITDGTATGTITNHDALPAALVARFGRAAAVHVLDQVEERVNAPRAPGFDGRVAGRAINRDMGRDFALELLQGFAGNAGTANGQQQNGMASHAGVTGNFRAAAGGSLGQDTPGQMPNTNMSLGSGLGLGGRDQLLRGSSFALNRATAGGGSLSLWSRSARSSFAGREDLLTLNGDVRTTMFGADYSRGRMVTGVSLSHSRGLGSYAGADSGQVTSAVTGLYPWIGFKPSEKVTVWTVAGHGAGSLLLQPGQGRAIETGLSMTMAAGGGRGELMTTDTGFELAFKADALWVGMRTDAASGAGGNLESTRAAVSRLRTAVEGSQNITIGNRLSVKPSLELGIRQDGGDAETGRGLDLGLGLALADRVTGLAIDVRVRRLLMHQAAEFAESGMSVSVSYDPSPKTPLGLTARVSPAWGGDSMSGAEALWAQETYGRHERHERSAARQRSPARQRGRIRGADRQALRRNAASRDPDIGVRSGLPAGLQHGGTRGERAEAADRDRRRATTHPELPAARRSREPRSARARTRNDRVVDATRLGRKRQVPHPGWSRARARAGPS